MNDIDTSSAPGATASIVQTVLNYAASPWRFVGLVVLLTITFSGVMVYVEREQIATYVLKNLGKPRLDTTNAQKVLTEAVIESRAKGGGVWSVDFENNIQTLVAASNFTKVPASAVDIGHSYPLISTGTNIKAASALMNGLSYCYDPADSNELQIQELVKIGAKWLCSSPIPNGLGALVGLIHIVYDEKPDQYVEQACIRAMAEAASKLTVR